MNILKFLRKNIILIIFIIIFVVWSLGPIVWTLIASVTPEVNLLEKPPKIVFSDFNFSTYEKLLTETSAGSQAGVREGKDFRKGMLNSIIVAIMTTVLCTIVSVISGYTISRYKFHGKRFLFLFIILTMPIPLVVIAIPLIRIVATLKLMDSHLGLSLIYTSFTLPLGMWLSASYIQTIPKELEEAAYIDGCNRFQAFFKIIVPLSKPIIGAVAIISFLDSWCQFFVPLVFAPSNAKQVTIVITEFVGKLFVDKDLISAAGIIALVPPAILILVFNKFIVGGLSKGALKE